MDKPFVDLHTHTNFSDGSMTPEQIVEAAMDNNVGILAITDHDTINGSLSIRQLCADNGIHYIPGVEVSTLDGSKLFHILAYGFDVKNAEFINYISHTRFMLDQKSVRLIEAMQNDYDLISLREYFEYLEEEWFGGWKALRYIVKKGVSPSLEDSIKFYKQYNIKEYNLGFPSIASTVYRIKKAGGYAVLAHPGKSIDTSDIDQFQAEVTRIIAYGLDGIECYYPLHSETVTQICLDVCERNNLLITTGSDCHGDFAKTKVSETRITLDKLSLKDLINA